MILIGFNDIFQAPRCRKSKTEHLFYSILYRNRPIKYRSRFHLVLFSSTLVVLKTLSCPRSHFHLFFFSFHWRVCVFSFPPRSRPSARAGPWVRNHIRHSRSPASSVISRSYVDSLSLSNVVVAWRSYFFFILFYLFFFADYCLCCTQAGEVPFTGAVCSL